MQTKSRLAKIIQHVIDLHDGADSRNWTPGRASRRTCKPCASAIWTQSSSTSRPQDKARTHGGSLVMHIGWQRTTSVLEQRLILRTAQGPSYGSPEPANPTDVSLTSADHSLPSPCLAFAPRSPRLPGPCTTQWPKGTRTAFKPVLAMSAKVCSSIAKVSKRRENVTCNSQGYQTGAISVRRLFVFFTSYADPFPSMVRRCSKYAQPQRRTLKPESQNRPFSADTKLELYLSLQNLLTFLYMIATHETLGNPSATFR